MQCPGSYCIPTFMVCNDVPDCPDASDEDGCANLTCVGLLACRDDRLCIHPTQACDGVVHCPMSGDDEMLCGSWWCPNLCICIGHIVYCRDVLPESRSYHFSTKGMVFRGAQITASYSFSQTPKALHIDLANCTFAHNTLHRVVFKYLQIVQIIILTFCNLEKIDRFSFEDQSSLLLIDLHGNHIHQLYDMTLSHFVLLMHLQLSNIQIKRIMPFTFNGLMEVRVLNLSRNMISKLHSNTFYGLPMMIVLDIRHNQITHIDSNMVLIFDGTVIVTNNVLCCYIDNPYSCISDALSKPLFTVCQSIFPNENTRNLYIYAGFLLLFTNIGNVLYIYKNSLTKQTLHLYLVLHLCAVDSLFVVYIISLSMISQIHRKDFLYFALLWNSSYMCHAMDALLLCGTLLSKSTVCLISINQLSGTKYALTKRYITKSRMLIVVISLWILTIIYTIISVFKESCYKITCSTHNHCSRLGNLTVHIAYILITSLFTFMTLVSYYTICTFVKESGNRVRSTRDNSVVYKKLIHHCTFSITMEILTLIAMSSLMIYSCLSAHKLSLSVTLWVAYLHGVVHTCVYTIRPVMYKIFKKE